MQLRVNYEVSHVKTSSIVIVSRNKQTYLSATLASVKDQTVTPNEVIVADDASDPPLTPIHGATHWIRREFPPHLQASRNQAISLATGDVVLLIDDDCLVPPNWLRDHLHRHEAFPGHLVVGTVCRINFRGESEFWTLPPFPYADEHRTFERRAALLPNNVPPWNLAPCSNNASISRSSLLQVGGFDEAYYGWGVDDVDLTYRLMTAGVPLLIDSAPKVFHQEHPRFVNIQAQQERYNLWVFARRHGFWPYGFPPKEYDGPKTFPPAGAWFHVRMFSDAPQVPAISVTPTKRPGPLAPRGHSPHDCVVGGFGVRTRSSVQE
jgi:GT2 family glycosyltransferase